MKQYTISGIEVGLDCKKDGITYRQAMPYASLGGKPYMIEISLEESFLKEKQKLNTELTIDDCEYIWTGYEFCKKILDFDGLVLHSSAVVYENRAYLFSAAPGTGKSTHTGLWQKVFGEDKTFIINDDKPAIRWENGGFFVYGTPWSGKTDKSVNTRVPLQGICFLERGEDNHIERISPEKAITLLLNQTVRPPEVNIMDKLLVIADRLLSSVPVYCLRCNMNDEAAVVSYNGMRGSV